MNILHVITTMSKGGAETHLATLAREQKKRGCTVTVAFLKRDTDFWRRGLEKADIQVIDLGFTYYSPVSPILRLRRLIKKLKPDVIHTHMPPAELYARFALLGSCSNLIPFFITKHNDERFAPIWGEKWLAQWTARPARKIICISKAVQSFWAERGVPENMSRSEVIYYGMNIEPKNNEAKFREEIGVTKSTVLFGYVGRLVPQKALDNLLESFALMSEQKATLVLVGEGPLRASLEAQTEKLAIAKRVIFAGFQKDIQNVMVGLDVLVLGSDYEGFGLVLLEAMAAERPILATGVSAIPEVVKDGETGLLVPARNPDAMAKGMRKFMDEELRCRFGMAGNKRLQHNFTVETMIEKTNLVYSDLIGCP